MKKVFIFFTLLVLTVSNAKNNPYYQLEVIFTTSIPQSNGIIEICEGTSITYTDVSTDVPDNATYNWSFEGGNIQTANNTGPYTITYNTPGFYQTTLSIDGTTTSVNVNVQASANITPVIVPDSWGTQTFNGDTYFTYCGNSTSADNFYANFSFLTDSQNTTSNSVHTISTEDGVWSETFTGINSTDPNFFIEFFLAPGYHVINYEITEGSCSVIQPFYLYVGANPTATISNDGVPVLCEGSEITYDLSYGAQNGEGTLYEISVGGTVVQTFNHPPPSTFTYTFDTVSCGQPQVEVNGVTYQNAYEISVTASNACGQSTSSIVPIYIESSPEADFNLSSGITGDIVTCQGETLIATDTTIPGNNISSIGECNDLYKHFWEIIAPDGSVLTSSITGALNPNPYVNVIGNMGFVPQQPILSNTSGANWGSNASDTLELNFLQSGIYQINIYAGSSGQSNQCGISMQSRTICVAPEVEALFDLSNYESCGATSVTSTNNSSEAGCDNTNLYQWNVLYQNPDGCPINTTPEWEFTNNTDANSFEPSFQFNTPGIYTVSLTVSLESPILGTSCESDTFSETVVIKEVPQITLDPIEVCQYVDSSFNLTFQNCYADNATTTYLWDFSSVTGITVDDITLLNPTINANTPGNYLISLTLSNECGSNTVNTTLEVFPEVTVTIGSPLEACANTQINLSGTISDTNLTGLWTASVSGGTFSPDNSNLDVVYTPPLDYTGLITFTLTSSDPNGPCPEVSSQATVEWYPEANVDAGTYEPYCMNSVIDLEGTVSGSATSATWIASVAGTFGNANQLNTTFTPPTDFTGTIVFTLTSNDPTGPCPSVEDTATLEILPYGDIDFINNSIVCEGDTVSVDAFTSTNTNSTYQWINDNTDIGLNATGSGNIPNFIAENTTNQPIVANITVTPIISSGSTTCEGTPRSFTITVNPSGDVNVPADIFLCPGDVNPEIILSSANTLGINSFEWTNDNTTIGLPASGSDNIPSFTAVNSGIAPETATITITPSYENNGLICEGIPVTFNITVNPSAQMDDPLDLILCEGVLSNDVVFTSQNSNGSMTYTWTNDNTDIGLAASGTGNITGFVPTNTTNQPIVATITVTPSFENGGTPCLGASQEFTITVNPIAQIDPVNDLTVCPDDTIPEIVPTSQTLGGNISYSWTNDNTAIGLSANGNGNIPSFTATNNALTPISSTITITPTYDNNGITCTGDSISYVVTVNPNAQINSVNDIIVCNNELVPELVFTSSNTGGSISYDWTNDNASIGLATSGTGSLPSFSAINNGISPISATISVTPYFSNNGITCSGQLEEFIITVNPTPDINPITSQTICNGDTFNTVSFSSSVSGVDYNWALQDVGSIPSQITGYPTSGSGNQLVGQPIYNDGINPFTLTYIVTSEYDGCSGDSTFFDITINPSPNVNFSSANQELCSGGTSQAVDISSTSSNVTLDWTIQNIPSGLSGVTQVSGTDQIPSFTLSNNTSNIIILNIDAFASTNDTNACQGTPSTYTISIFPDSNITTQPTGYQTLCEGGQIEPLTLTLSSSNLNPTITWYSNTIASTTGGTTVGTGNSFQPDIYNSSGFYYYYAEVTYTTTGCDALISDIATVEVLNDPTISLTTLDQTVCQNSTLINPIEFIANGDASDLEYQFWVSNTNDYSNASVFIPWQVSNSFTPPTDSIGTFYYFCEVRYITDTDGSLNCSTLSDISTITVIENATVDVQPLETQTTCLNAIPTTLSVSTVNGVGNPAYQWFSNTSATNSGGTLIPNANQNAYVPPTDTVGTLYYYCVVNFDLGCDPATSNVSEVIVEQEPVIEDKTIEICSGETFSLTPITEGNDIVPVGTTYIWSVIDNPNTVGEMDEINPVSSISQTLNNSTNAVEVVTYVVTPSSGSNGACMGNDFMVYVTVNPTPNIGDKTIEICSGEIATFDLATDGALNDIIPTDTILNWSVIDNTNVTGESDGSGTLINQTLTNNSNAPQDVIYTINTSTSTCVGNSFTLIITINPIPVVNDYNTTVCSNTTFDATPIDGINNNTVPSNTLFTWSVIDNNSITGDDDQLTPVNSIVLNLSSSSNIDQTVTYIVTPVYNSCPGNPYEMVVTVGPEPDISDAILPAICSGDSFMYDPSLDITNNVPNGTTFTWTVIDNPFVSGEQDITTPQTTIGQNLSNESNIIQNVIYTITPTTGSCSGSSFELTVPILPTPYVTNNPITTTTQCSGQPFVIVPQNGIPDVGTIIPANTTYTWVISVPNPNITGWSNNSLGQANISQTLTNTTNTPQQITYTITPEANGCVGNPFDAVIWVEPIPYVPDVTQDLCDGESFILTPENGLVPDTTAIIPNVTTYSWSTPMVTGGVIGWTTANDAAYFDSGVLQNPTTQQQTVTYTVTPAYNVQSNAGISQCEGSSFTVTITVNPSPDPQATINNIACSYTEPVCSASIELNPIGGAPFTFLWTNVTDPTSSLINPTDQNQYNLCPGDYQVAITDAYGCEYSYTYTIAPPTPVDITLISLLDMSCNNISPNCDGYIEVELQGGTLPYSLIEWYTESIPDSGVFDIPVDNGLLYIQNVCEGNYVLKVLDANGCEFVSPTYTVNNSNNPIVIDDIISDYNGNNVSCQGYNDGFIEVSLSGGSGIFSYVLNPGNIQDSDPSTPNLLEFDNLQAGNYTLTITDTNCPSDISIDYMLTEPALLSGTATLISDPILCHGGTATYSITATGGTPPYTGLGSYTFAAGTNSVTITDANGCESIVSVFVTEPSPLVVSANITSPILCHGDSGIVTITASGGTPPYAGVGNITVSAGDYYYTVTDANNCSYSNFITIDEPDALLYTIDSTTNPTCSPDWSYTNGSICITITGGTNPFPTGNGWTDYGNGSWCLENLSAGNYTIDVTDDNSCTSNGVTDITLTRPSAIDAYITSNINADCSTNTITQTNYVFVTGGTPPYEFTWSGGEACNPINPQCMETTVSGTYTVYIHDQESLANGCPPIEVDVVVDLPEIGDPAFSYNSPNSTLCNVLSLNEPITFNNESTGDIVNITWDFGDGSFNVVGDYNPTHIYTAIGTYQVELTVEYPFGCTEIYTEILEITKGYDIVLPNAFTPNGDGVNDTIRPVTLCMAEIQMSIYDTWGSLLYVEVGEDDTLIGWDGTIKGRPAENGNYIIVVEATTYRGETIELNGPITLIK